MNPIAALFSAISAAPGLSALLAQYRGAPAIFSGDVIPQDFDIEAKPCVIVGPIQSNTDADDFSAPNRFVTVAVRIYARSSASSAAIDEVARRVRVAIHRKILSDEGFGPVSGPVSASTSGPEIAGRRMEIRLFYSGE